MLAQFRTATIARSIPELMEVNHKAIHLRTFTMKATIMIKPFALRKPFPRTMKALGLILPAVIVVAS
jgi:hypothetical protein